MHRRYRKSTLHQPGTRIVHLGAADDAIPEHIVFGAATIPSEPVGDVIASYPSSELARWTLDRSEDVYASVRREPLGRGYTRGHALPDGLGTTKGFGVDGEVAPTSSVVNGLIFPKDTEYLAGDAETSDAHKMYVKTHGNYAPGEQKRRDYDWAAAGVDPNATTFGAVDTAKYDQFEGVAKALNPLKDETMPHYSASIVDARVEAFNATNRDELGKVKNLGLGEEIPDGHVFGAPSRKTIEWDAGKLIKGDYSEEAQLPDADLGKSMKHQGYVYDPSDRSAAALPAGADPSRAFGVPSTRRDLAAIREKSTRSVADVTNYGDEPSASAIIFPPNGADRGVEEGDYLATYDAEVRSVYTLVPIRPRSRGERRSLRTFAVVSLRPPRAFNARPRRLSTPPDAYELHPDIASYGTTLRRCGRFTRRRASRWGPRRRSRARSSARRRWTGPREGARSGRFRGCGCTTPPRRCDII